MYSLFHLKNCFKCMCLHLEFECFASKLEMATSEHGVDLWVYGGGMFYCLWCDHMSSAVHSWLDVFTVILYPRKYGPVTSRLGGDSAPTASIPGSATQLMSLGQDSHRLHWFSCELYSSIWVRDSSVTVVQCSLHVLILQRCPLDRCHWSIGSQQGLCAKTDCRVGT